MPDVPDWTLRPIGELDSSDASEDESELGFSQSRESTTTATSREEEIKVELAKRETIIVTRLRILVFLVLLLAAISVSLVVYYITTQAENQESDNQYETAADKVLEQFVEGAKIRLGAVASLAVAVVAHGVDHQVGWPFVTVVSPVPVKFSMTVI